MHGACEGKVDGFGNSRPGGEKWVGVRKDTPEFPARAKSQPNGPRIWNRKCRGQIEPKLGGCKKKNQALSRIEKKTEVSRDAIGDTRSEGSEAGGGEEKAREGKKI